jgi:hypothetical protein
MTSSPEALSMMLHDLALQRGCPGEAAVAAQFEAARALVVKAKRR